MAEAVLGLALLAGGCATRPAVSAFPGRVGATERAPLRLGRVAMASAETPAIWSFQTAKGKLGSAKEAFYDAVEIGASGPVAAVAAPGVIFLEATKTSSSWGEVYVDAALSGLAGGAIAVGSQLVAPVIAADGLIRSWRKVSPAELGEREAALAKALSEMAQQEPLQDALLKATMDFPGRVVPMMPSFRTTTEPAGFDAVLEARVEELRLERARADEGSYFLRIRTHVTIRAANGMILRDQTLEYRSGRCLFLDWTLAGSVQSVAETGYQALARCILHQAFGTASSDIDMHAPHAKNER